MPEFVSSSKALKVEARLVDLNTAADDNTLACKDDNNNTSDTEVNPTIPQPVNEENGLDMLNIPPTLLPLIFFYSIPTHPDAPRFYHLAQIGTNRGRNRDCVKPQLHCHDFGPRQSYDSPRFVKSGCIGMILSSAVAPP